MNDEMTTVYLLQHSYEKPQGYDETKVIGIFKSRDSAEEAISGLKDLPGFSDHSVDCFHLDKYDLGRIFWVEGFGID